MILSVIAFAIILSAAGFYYYTRLQAGENNEGVLETTTISTGDIILSATGLGTLIPSEEVSFGFKNSGQVSEVLVSLGEKVEAGQVLARLENKTQELKYKQAEANLAALTSPAEMAAAEQAVQEARESFAVARDDLGYLIGPEMLIAEENVAEAQNDLQLAKVAAEKDASEANKQKVSAAEAGLVRARETLTYVFYNYSSNYTLNTFTLRTPMDDGSTSARKTLYAPTEVDIAIAHAVYELALANLNDAQNYLDVLHGLKTSNDVPTSSVTSITEAKLALDSARADLDATELIAPISGTITSLDFNAGENVGASAVITISNANQPYTIDAYLDETDWDKAKLGFAASVTFDLLPDDNYSATVRRVYPMLDDSSGTSMVHILLQLDDPIEVDLPVGSTASVDVTGGEALGVVLVPVSALKETEPGKYVVYLMQNGEPLEQEVQIGLQDILYAEVKSGLKAGDIVLTDATYME